MFSVIKLWFIKSGSLGFGERETAVECTGRQNALRTSCLIPWVPEVSRGPLRDLPAEGRRPTNERRRREKTSGEERFDLLFSLNFDHSYRITFKPITANISYCDHMHQHVKIRQI